MVSSSSCVWQSITCSFSTLSRSTAVREFIHWKSNKSQISGMHTQFGANQTGSGHICWVSILKVLGWRVALLLYSYFTTAPMRNSKGKGIGRILLEYQLLHSEKIQGTFLQKTSGDKWQSTRVLVLLVHYLCSSTLSVQRSENEDYYNTSVPVLKSLKREIRRQTSFKGEIAHLSLTRGLSFTFCGIDFYV